MPTVAMKPLSKSVMPNADSSTFLMDERTTLLSAHAMLCCGGENMCFVMPAGIG